MTTSALTLAGLSKRFGDKAVLDGVSLEMQRGECLVVFGPSGCGKTTLLRLISGILEPDAGDVLLDGESVSDRGPESRGVAMAFQNFALYPHMSAFENIASPLRARGVDEKTIDAKVHEVAKLIRIDHVLDHLPRQLSNGQKQRTSLARSLVHAPSVLLLDDPLRNVDAKIRFEMRLEFPRLFKTFGTTVLYVTQDYREALALGDRVGVLDQGRFQQLDTPAGIYRNPRSREVARLFGDPPINLFEVTPRHAGGCTQVDIGGGVLALPDARPDLHDKPCVLGVRPEDVLFSTEGGAGALAVALEASMPINVRTVSLLKAGEHTEILTSRPEDPVLAARRERLPGFARLVAGRAMFFDRATGARI